MKKLRSGSGTLVDVNDQINVVQGASGARHKSTPSSSELPRVSVEGIRTIVTSLSMGFIEFRQATTHKNVRRAYKHRRFLVFLVIWLFLAGTIHTRPERAKEKTGDG